MAEKGYSQTSEGFTHHVSEETVISEIRTEKH
jgi:hypothetical protein